MAKKKADPVDIDLKRELTCMHVTMGMIRAAVSEMEVAVSTKDKEKFRDCLNKIKVHTRCSATSTQETASQA